VTSICIAGTTWDGTICKVNAANVPPVVNAGPDKTVTQPADSTSVTGTATDSDGTIISTLWTKVSGGTITSPASLSTTITGLSTIGTYTYRLTATDNSGATASDEMTVTVSAAPVVLKIDSFVATPNQVLKGRPSTLTWTSTGADLGCVGTQDVSETISANNFDTGLAQDGNDIVKPTQTTIYTLTCSRSGAPSTSATSTANVKVIVPIIIEN
jgi:hypothetical protein